MRLNFTVLDTELFRWLNNARLPFLDWFMPLMSDFKLFLPFIVAFIAWRFWKGKTEERIAWCAGIVAVIASDAICARVIKPLVNRHRPYEILDGIYLYKHSAFIVTDHIFRNHIKDTLAWPSCHAMNMWTATSFLFSYSRKNGLLLAFAALIVCYSRIYLGVHYPADVAGGAIAGAILGTGSAMISKKIFRNMDTDTP